MKLGLISPMLYLRIITEDIGMILKAKWRVFEGYSLVLEGEEYLRLQIQMPEFIVSLK